MNHGNLYPSFTGFRQSFVVFAQPSAPAQPGQSAFHHPSSGQHLKAVALSGTPDNRQGPAGNGMDPVNQLSSMAAIGPDQAQPGKPAGQLVDNQLGPVPVLDIGRMHHHCQQQSQGVYHDMTLAPPHFLAGVVAARPPFPVVFTDWLSIMAAAGLVCRPAASWTLGRRASWICSHTPSCRQWRKYHHTVPQGGRSWGSIH